MIIGIDANWLIYENAGIGKYSQNIILEILKNDHKNRYILFANFVRKFQERKKILQDLVVSSGNTKTQIIISRIPSAWREWLGNTNFPQKWLIRKPVDLYFSTYFSGIAKNGFPKQVVVLYDLVFLFYPEHAGIKLSDYYLKRTKNALANSQKIITISHSTKNDLIEKLKVDPSKIEIAYPGVDKNIFQPKSKTETAKIIKKYHINKPYILSVCTLEPRKNLETLIDAYQKLPEDMQKNYQLVLVGKSGWNNNNLKSQISNLKSKIIETGYIPEKDLPYLYSGADIFVYPSYYEGFGLPVLEAMTCGCPVIVSNNSSLPEVVGTAGILVDSKNIPELAKSINDLLLNENELSLLREKGLTQSQKFSWKKSAIKIIKLFELI